jgi:hypothetical protein
LKSRTDPSSIFTGKLTMISFFGWLRMVVMYDGSAMSLAASSR